MRPQSHWDWRAAANFMLGGAGAGLLACAPLLDDLRGPLFLGLALVATGLAAVWLEIGRKLRALHVFFNPFTSWMTRESFAALMLFLTGMGFLSSGWRSLFYGAVICAATFLYCQARILFAAKGIPAWRVPEIVPLIVATGVAEGAGLALLFDAPGLLRALFALAVAARLAAWLRHPLAPGKTLAWWSTGAALVLIAVAPPVAGLAAFAAGAWLKFALVTRASHKQEFSLPYLPVRGSR